MSREAPHEHEHEQERDHATAESSALESESAEQPSRTKFTSKGDIPPADDGMPAPVQPSASDRAYGPSRTPARAARPGARRGEKPTPGVGPDTALKETVQRVVAGVTVIAPAGAHALAIDRCAEIIHQEIGRNLYAQQKLAAERATVIIIPAGTQMTDVAQFSGLDGKRTFDGRDWSGVRGSGGMRAPDGSFAIGVAEENLITVRGVTSKYPTGYSIAMHEIAHALESKGMTPAQHQRLEALFATRAKQDPGDLQDTFTDRYAAANVHEYFAQATNAFFGKNAGKEGRGGRANDNGKAALYAKDPQMYAFLVEMYETNHDAEGNRMETAAGAN